MSVLTCIQQELRNMFNHDVGFKNMQKDDRPCTACVGSLHRHTFLRCCSSEIGELCVVCKEKGKECMAIPQELLGAAQSLWNHAKDIADKHSDQDAGLNGLRRWRLHCCLQRACTAWNELLEFVDRPIELGDAAIEAVKVQESILSREISTSRLLLDAGLTTFPDELRARLAALAPPGSRHVGPARRLREAVAGIPLAENVPAPNVAEEGAFLDFPELLAADVVANLAEFSGIAAPACAVRYPGVRLRICGDGGGDEAERATGSVETREAREKEASAAANESTTSTSSTPTLVPSQDQNRKRNLNQSLMPRPFPLNKPPRNLPRRK